MITAKDIFKCIIGPDEKNKQHAHLESAHYWENIWRKYVNQNATNNFPSNVR